MKLLSFKIKLVAVREHGFDGLVFKLKTYILSILKYEVF